MFPFRYQFGGTVQLVGLEEGAGAFAGQSFYFIVELGA